MISQREYSDDDFHEEMMKNFSYTQESKYNFVKLSIPRSSTDYQTMYSTAIHMILSSGIKKKLLRLHIASIVAILRFGLINPQSRYITFEEPVKNLPDIPVTFTEQDVSNALQMIIFTKINFFITEFHYRSENSNGLIENEIDRIFKNNLKIGSKFSIAINRIGNWASTHIVLRKIGYKGLKKIKPLSKGLSIPISKKIKFYSKKLPFGCEKLEIAQNILKKLIDSPILKYVPNVIQLKVIMNEDLKVSQNLVAYHEFAQYLTGKKRLKFEEEKIDSCFGRLGTFMSIFHPENHFNQTEFFQKNGVFIYEKYKDFSLNFKIFCASYKANETNSNLRALSGAFRSIIQENTKAAEKIKKIFQKYQIKKKYKHHKYEK